MLNLKSMTKVFVSLFLCSCFTLVHSMQNTTSKNPFLDERYLEAKDLLINNNDIGLSKIEKSISGCINGVAMIIAGRQDVAKQYIEDYPYCVESTLNKYTKNEQLNY